MSRIAPILLASWVLASVWSAEAQQLTSARIDPLVIRAGVETLSMTATVSDPEVIAVTIDTGSALTVAGSPVSSVTLLDDGSGGDVSAGDGIFTAAGIGFQSATVPLGGTLLRFRDIDFLYSDLSTVSTVQDLGLTLRYIDPFVPIPTYSDVAPDVRATTHVVSITMPLSGAFPSYTVSAMSVAQRYYQLFPDDRDWLLLAYPFNTVSAAGDFGAVRNDVQGIGRTLFDDSAAYGSSGVLRGIAQLYYNAPAGYVTINHEIFHQFGVYLDSGLDLGIGHWDVVTGPSSVLGNGTFDDIDFISGNTYWALPFTHSMLLNPLELYLMGLIDISQVPSPIETLVNPVLQGYGSTFCDARGCAVPRIYEADSLRAVTTSEILIVEGGRVPSHKDTPKSYRAAMIVVYDRTLSPVELAYYDHSMQEYEQPTSSLGTTFYEATGGLADITTEIPEPGGLLMLAAGVAFLATVGQRRRSREARASARTNAEARRCLAA